MWRLSHRQRLRCVRVGACRADRLHVTRAIGAGPWRLLRHHIRLRAVSAPGGTEESDVLFNVVL